jgi:peptidoglycan/LPS O-acetylase OafA/YrhL
MHYLKEKLFISVKKYKFSLSRITSSGNFIPEIDGLRFIMVIAIVAFHLSGFLIAKDVSKYTSYYNFDFIFRFIQNGDIALHLFFVLSGFILGMPFAQHHLLVGKKINLKNYTIRRITRVEPPYVIAMVFLFIGTIFYTNNYTTEEAIKSFFASITYTHNFIYGKQVLPLINCVAWSLEIEIQFYILAPLLSLIFTIKNKYKRRCAILTLSIIFSVLTHYSNFSFVSILDYLQFFLIGFLLVDLYLTVKTEKTNSALRNIFTLASLLLIFCFNIHDFSLLYQKILWDISVLFLILILYYNVLIHKSLPILSQKIITNIGGMCYSIYLLHFAVISFFGNPLMQFSFSNNQLINSCIYTFILSLAILIVSTLFYLLIEQPSMDKNWPTKFKNYIKRIK